MKIKKQKAQKKCIIKRKLKFHDHKNCLRAAQIVRKINYLRNKIDVDNLKEDQKEFIKNNKLILKKQQRFKSENHNIFNEEVNKIALCSDDDKRM